jgi:cephalosporin hydroxylase
MNHTLKRIINFLRPRPQYIKLPVEEILGNTSLKSIVDKFNDFYYKSGNSGNLNWRGAEMLKNPCDLWSYIDIFQELKPSVIIETGTHHGASAMFYADICNILNINSKVITIDINPKWNVNPESLNILSIKGKSTDDTVVDEVRTYVERYSNTGNIVVLLDSDHSKENVLRELSIYSQFVTEGSYVVVEDTNVNGHPSFPEHGPGPWEAVDKFLDGKGSAHFEVDRTKERFLLTFNPRGYLRKKTRSDGNC